MTPETPQKDGKALSLYDRAGGTPRLKQLVDEFYRTLLEDELLSPLFRAAKPDHVDHLTAWMVEVLGGPTRYTDEIGGFSTLLAAHRHLKITEPQAERFAALFQQAIDTTGLADDPTLRDRLTAYIHFGVDVAVQNSNADTDADLHPCQVVPRWT